MDGWTFEHSIVRFYIDDDAKPSIEITLLQLGFTGHFYAPTENA